MIRKVSVNPKKVQYTAAYEEVKSSPGEVSVAPKWGSN